MSFDLTEIAKINALIGKLNAQETTAELAKKLGVVNSIQSEQAMREAIGNQLGITNELKNGVLKQFELEKDLIGMTMSPSEAARAFVQQQSTSLAIAKSMVADDEMAREALKKLALNPTLSSSAISQLAIQQEALALYKNYDAIFRLPEKSEVSRLLESFEIGQVAKFAAIQSIEQKRFVESITTPWINAVDIARSISGVLELQGIGNALRLTSGFDLGLTDALRFDLGDWRDKLDFTNFELLNPIARTDFYLGRGFNSALTDMPEEAFEQSLELAGFNSDIFDIESNEGILQSDGNISDEIGLRRTNKCHDILQRFERKLRQVIDYLMTKQYGSNWPKKKLQPIIYDKWEDKRKKAESYGENIPVIDLMDFTEYEIIICQKDLWNEVFKNIFRRPESVRESFQRLYPIRLNTMHSRIVTLQDKVYLEVEVHRILRAIQKVSIQ